jgi:gliding motility-associated-like protein
MKNPYPKTLVAILLLSLATAINGFAASFNPPANDNFASATDVTSYINATCTSFGAFTTVGATPDLAKPACWSFGPHNNVWFKFTATSNKAITIKVLVSGVGESLTHEMVAILDASQNVLTCEDANTAPAFDGCLGMSGLTPGATYYIEVDNQHTIDAGTFDICLSDAVLATISYPGSPYCATGTAIVNQTGQTGGAYNSTAGLALDPTSGSIDLGASTPGTYTVNYNFSNGTCSQTATTAVVVNPSPNATISYAPSSYFASSVFCQSGIATVTLTGQTGGVFSSTTGLVINPSTGNIDLVASTPGSYTVSYFLTNGTCSSTTTANMSIVALPQAIMSYPGSPYCATGTALPTQSGQGGGVYSSTPGLNINAATGAIDLAGSTPGVYTVTYSYTNGTCNNTATASVTVNALPSATITYAATPYTAASFCAAGTAAPTLNGQTGGSYSSTSGLSIDAVSGVINLAASTPGNYTVTYSSTNGTCSNTTTTMVTVNPLPAATIAYTGSPYCATGTATAAVSGQGGGSFSASSNLALDAATGNVNLATSVPGTYTVTYTFNNGTCSNTTTASITILATVASASINYGGSPFCAAGTGVVTQTGAGGGVYSATSGLTIDPATGAIDLAGSTPGAYAVTYTFPNGACSNSSTTVTNVTVNALPVATIAYPASPYCASGAATPVQTGQTGGTYSSTPGLSVNAASGVINLAASVPGVYTVTYSFSNGVCNNTATSSVTVRALASATISYMPNPYYAPGIFCQTGTTAVTQTGQGGGVYSAGAGLVIDPSSGLVNLGVSTPGSYTVTYSFTDGSCPNTTTVPITVQALPVATIAYPGSPYCATGNAAPAVTGQGGGNYASTTGLVIDAGTGVVDLATSSAGTYTVTYTFSNGPCSSTTTTTITVNALPAATIAYAGSPYCATGMAAPVLTGQSGGVYSSTSGLVINTSTGVVDLAGSTPGSYTVTYTFTNGTCSNTATTTIGVVAPSTLVITNPAAVCAPSTVDLTAAVVTAGSSSGLMYGYYTDAAATNAVSDPAAVAVSGVYYIKGTNSNSCSTIAPVTVTINAQPTATISYGGSPYCLTATAVPVLTGQGGGVYSSTTGLSIDAGTGVVNLGASTAGVYTITCSFTNGVCNNATTASITVQALPTATIAYTGSPYCNAGTAAPVLTGQGGGVYSGPTGLSIDASSGVIDLGVSAPGTYTVTYSFSNGVCSNTTTASVTINAMPTATIGYAGSPFCATGTATVMQTGQTGGTYTADPGLVINHATGKINLGASPAGTYTVTYSFTNGTCSVTSTATTSVTILPTPTATIAYPGSPYCATGTAAVTLTGQTGGAFTSTTGLIVDPVSGTVNIASSTPGTYTVTYTFSNGGCSNFTSTSLTILNPSPTATISYAGSPYCAVGTASVTLSGQAGGVFSAAGGLVIDASSGAVDLAASVAGTYTVTYTFGSGACGGSTTTSIAINALPNLVVNNPAGVCAPSTVDLTAAAVTAGSSGGLTYGYYSDAAATVVLSNPNAVGVSGTYYIQATNAGGCTAIQPVTVNVNALPLATIAYPGSPYCTSGSATVVQTGQGGGTYSSSPAGLVIDPSTGTVDMSASTPGTYTVTYTFSNGVCSNTATTTITINALPVAAITYPGSPYCGSGFAMVTLTGTGGGTFTSTSGLKINSSTGNINLWASAPGTYTVTYVFGNGTCSNSTTCSIVVVARPVLVITNPLAVCAPATVDLTAAAVTAGSSGGLVYGYFTDAAATVVLSNPNAVGVSGTYYIQGTNTNGCSLTRPVVVTIKTPPTATIGYTGTPYCGSGTASVVLTGQSGGTFSAAAGLVINASTGSVNLAGSTPGTYTVTYTFSNGTCGNTTTASIAILAAPSVVITNPAPVCTPASVDLTAAAVTAGSDVGLTYFYYTDAAGTTVLTNPNAVASPSTYYIKGVNTNGCSSIQPVTVTMSAPPTASISYAGGPYCTAGSAVPSVTGQGGGVYSAGSGLSIDAGTGVLNLAASTPGVYTITYAFSNGSCSSTTTTGVTVSALPVATIAYSGSPFCASGTATPMQTGQAGGVYSSTPGLVIDASTGTVSLSASTAGTYTVTYTFGNGTCSNTATTSITVNTLPVATIAYSGTPYCAIGTATVTQTGTAAGFYSSASGLHINAATGDVDLAASTPGSYTVIYTFGNGTCNNVTTTTIMVNSASTASITYMGSPYCPSGTAAVTVSGQAGGAFSAPAGLAIDASSGVVDLAASTPGTYTVTYSFTSAPCGTAGVATGTIVVSAPPVATIAYTGSPYCAVGSASVALTGAAGGSYSASAGLSLNASTGAVNLAGSTPGTYTVTYTFTNGTCSGAANASITVNALPTATIVYSGSPYCKSGMAGVTLTGPAGGVYSSTAGLVLNASTGGLNLAASMAGTYTVTYTFSDGSCSNVATTSVTVNALPVATIAYAQPAFCATGTATVVLTGQTGGTYSAPAGLVIDATRGVIDLGGSTAGTYTVSYVFTNGSCNNTTTTTVKVNALPTATISYSPGPYYASQPFCKVGTAAVTLTGQAGGVFSAGSGLAIDAASGEVNLAGSTPGTYMVTYTFSNGTCSSTTTTSISILASVATAGISYPGTPFCATGVAAVSLSGQTGGVFIAPAGLSINATTGQIDLGGSAPGTYTVTYSFSNGSCANTTTASVTVVALASASISYAYNPYSTTTTYCAIGTASVVLTGQTGGVFGSTTGLVIDPATGTIDLGASVTGTYTVSYSFTNGNCSNASTTTATLTIIPLPVAGISYPASPYCATGAATVVLTGQTGGIFSSTVGLALDPTTGTINLGACTGGVYTVNYTFSNGTCTNTVSTTVTINALPTATISYAPSVYYANSIYCTIGQAVVTQTGTTGGIYSSTPGLALDPGTGGVNLNATTPGTYTVTYTFSDGHCSNTTTTKISIIVSPTTAAISYPASPYCGTGTAVVTLTGQTGGFYSAAAGLVIDYRTGAINVSASTPGTYTVVYTFNSGTCIGNTAATVTVSPAPNVVITNPAPVCMPGTIDLTAPAITAGSDAGLTFSYFANQAGTIPVTNPTEITTSSIYYIQGANSTSCASLPQAVTAVLGSRPALMTGGDSVICKGSSAHIHAYAQGNVLVWSGMNSSADTVVVTPDATTSYTVTASNNSGCIDTAVLQVRVIDHNLKLTADPDPVQAGYDVTLISGSDSAYTVLGWWPSSEFSDDSAMSQTFVISDSSQLFKVVGRSVWGCVDTAVLVVNVTPNPKSFFVPNAFTPNRDGVNDIFKAYGSSIQEIDLRVFNQWGQQLWETRDPEKGWDGTYSGHDQPVGVYIYVVRAVLYGGQVITKRGTVNLIR